MAHTEEIASSNYMETLTERDFKPAIAEAAPNMVQFTNHTKEDFTYPFNSKEYTFKVGVPVQMERTLADHFAKHLANRELLAEGRENDTSPKVPEENPFFMAHYNKCIAEIDPSIVAKVEVALKPTKVDGRKKVKETEFEDLPEDTEE